MDEETRDHLRRQARRFFSEGADGMTDLELRKLDDVLGVVRRVESIEQARERERETPFWKKPDQLARTVASVIAIVVVLLGWVWSQAMQASSIESVKIDVNRLDARVTSNRAESREEIKAVESRHGRALEIANEKLDRVLFLLNERRAP